MNERAFRSRLTWDWMTAACKDGDGEHRACIQGQPANIATETLIIRDGGIDDGELVRNYEIWHDAQPPVDVVLAGKLWADRETHRTIEQLTELINDVLRAPLASVSDEEALIALVIAGYEHLIDVGECKRADFDYR